MHAKLRPNRNCGCSLEQAFFLIAVLALLLEVSRHAQARSLR